MQYVWRDRVAQALRKFMYLATTVRICLQGALSIQVLHAFKVELPNPKASLCVCFCPSRAAVTAQGSSASRVAQVALSQVQKLKSLRRKWQPP